ncbi:hypothetical protein MLD38_031718 [Melastoma candidum]|uniref:Uncharacterized protein n=1 Tax=Melastoma candidum TaxID=119954 RepID=A0ACB9MPX9_9MYRT|nr:hypothetical protein MLD38_031718 [Melastoma candidum]
MSTSLPLPLLLLSVLEILAVCVVPCVASNPEALFLYTWLHGSSGPSTPLLPPSFSNWNLSDPDPCRWSHVECSPQGFVTGIDIQSLSLGLPFPTNLSSLAFLRKLIISGSNITGSIPADIGDCSRMTTLDVSSNGLVGGIPPSIGRLGKLQDLVLNSNQITGSIPPEIGNCTSLRNLILFDNSLSEGLPLELGNLSELEVLRVGGNKEISGKIPEEIGRCKKVQVIGLADTKVSGSIPASLGELSRLETLSVYTTMLSGEIPPEIANCTELVDLFLYENNLSGRLPTAIGNLKKLEKLLLWQNSLEGPIPEQIGDCESLKIVDLSLNSFSGSIPQSIGNLTNLEELMLSNNNISGSIPPAISNCRGLVQLQLDTNQISSSIPPEIGLLTQMTVFFAWQNNLGGSIPSSLADCASLEVLDLSHNALTGSLPPSLFRLQNLTKVLVISNKISGTLPPEIGGCSSLVRLRLAQNRISGPIPREIGFLSSLSFLDMSGNHLNGAIPEEIGNCTDLQMLDLSNNSLDSSFPSSLSSLKRLQVLDVSFNGITGQIPGNFGQFQSLSRLILRRNSISGPIPPSLGQCSTLQLLDLSGNALSGTIPAELFKLKSLEIALNLSWNSLSGIIPPEISSLDKLSVLDLSHNRLRGDLLVLLGMDNLVSLNISHNDFTGYLPDAKLFHQLPGEDLSGNPGLCTEGLASCFVNSSTASAPNWQRPKQSKIIKVAIALLVTLTIVLAVFGGLSAVVRARRLAEAEALSDKGGEKGPWQFTPFQKLDFSIEQVLKCLVEENIIGKGCSGVVYRARLDNGEAIAVKKLWPTNATAPSGRHKENPGNELCFRDSFSAEVGTLGSIRHKNIVRFLGCCWNRNTKLLLYDYMPNGNLGSLLHERGGNFLEWELRYQIILGAARGLAYLHHDCVPPIVHRDIKANNILIGPEFEPYIADFGLAKLVRDRDFIPSSSTIAGSYGYIAPEYGYMMKITEKSDVYSFGVVMLEVLTGKQPIDPTIPEGLHIVDWIRGRKARAEVLDAGPIARPESEIEEMVQTLGVAMLCVNPSPNDRPTMKDVAAMVEEIRQRDREEFSSKAAAAKRQERGGDSPNCTILP